MQPCLTFVLGGGGARGAFQVGALRALYEAGLKPDLLVGTSIGAVNAAAVALWGFDETGLYALELAYQKMSTAGLLDLNLSRLAMQALSGNLTFESGKRTAEFLKSTGLPPELTFGDLTGPRLAVVGADLEIGRPVIYGLDPTESILSGVLASMSIPPWFAPIQEDGHFILDGGALSNLAIEPSLGLGATEIYALDLEDPAAPAGGENMLVDLLRRLWFAIGRRSLVLEMELAKARNVLVHHIPLNSEAATPVWDFSDYPALIRSGYEQAKEKLEEFKIPDP
ncbi:MAG TPA: patatin-like phospholipase family protein [Promineifilum sp.]|nr:patatin-like phospholipase family protein [Promineifilum sp.]HRO90875.1 patatin-like phospholipase family protein [Promineifilum sp.]